jgi:hypothetical protein
VDEGFDVVPVNPSRFLYYSRMSPGILSRIYHPEETRVDVRYLVEKGRGRFIRGRFLRSKGIEVLLGTEVVKIEESVAHARDGRRLGFDLTVLAVGITPLEIFRESGLATSDDGGL